MSQEQEQKQVTEEVAPEVAPAEVSAEQKQVTEEKKIAEPKMSFLEAIKIRSSIRNFSRVPTPEESEYIQECIRNLPRSGPFPDSEARFVYIPVELGFTSSYGVIGGPHHFLCGATKRGPHELETYGYLFERLQLECYRIGLGTVWLGGTFSTGSFASYIDIKDPNAEIMPAVSPVGLSTGTVGWVAGFLKWVGGSTSRKDWSELFFDGKYGNPITNEAAGRYAEALEAVRKAPSAINKQPWIIIRDDKGAWHFYCHLYRPLSRCDLGICMCHWEVACNELGLHGSWKILEEPLTEQLSAPNDCPYISTWIPAEGSN